MSKMIICSGCGEEKPLYAKGLCSTCYQHKWREENQEHKCEYQKENREKRQRNVWKSRLKCSYGITTAEYHRIFEIQGGACAICGKTPERDNRKLAVDHDHGTGKVRGLLCRNCNIGLGYFMDNPTLTAKATKYLSMWKEEDFVEKDGKKK